MMRSTSDANLLKHGMLRDIVNLARIVFIDVILAVLLSACATPTPESEAKRAGAPARDPSLICDELVIKLSSPPYPSSAFRQGTEGWVLLEFALDGTGAAKNIVVVSSSPKSVFERSALNGLMRTEFNLKAVRSKCQSIVTFTLH